MDYLLSRDPLGYCCPNCFEHPWMKEFVRSESQHSGTCGYCGTLRVRLLDLQLVGESFGNLLDELVPEDWGLQGFKGEPLLEALQRNWKILAPLDERLQREL